MVAGNMLNVIQPLASGCNVWSVGSAAPFVMFSTGYAVWATTVPNVARTTNSDMGFCTPMLPLQVFLETISKLCDSIGHSHSLPLYARA